MIGTTGTVYTEVYKDETRLVGFRQIGDRLFRVRFEPAKGYVFSPNAGFIWKHPENKTNMNRYSTVVLGTRLADALNEAINCKETKVPTEPSPKEKLGKLLKEVMAVMNEL